MNGTQLSYLKFQYISYNRHMIVLETKLKGTVEQYGRLDEAIRTAQFVRNSCIRYWLDNRGVGKGDLSKLCAQLASEFEWAKKLNSMARQASAERAWLFP